MHTIALRAALVAPVVIAVAALGVLTATADDGTIYTTVGSQAELVGDGVVQGWTISDLKPSSETLPFPIAGTLWEATATDVAIQGTVTPAVANLYARTRIGRTYRALLGAGFPEGIDPATLPQGESTTGKIYFDVTGEGPDSVVYYADRRVVAVWMLPPPAPPTSPPPTTSAPPGNGRVPVDERYRGEEQLENVEGSGIDGVS